MSNKNYAKKKKTRREKKNKTFSKFLLFAWRKHYLLDSISFFNILVYVMEMERIAICNLNKKW